MNNYSYYLKYTLQYTQKIQLCNKFTKTFRRKPLPGLTVVPESGRIKPLTYCCPVKAAECRTGRDRTGAASGGQSKPRLSDTEQNRRFTPRWNDTAIPHGGRQQKKLTLYVAQGARRGRRRPQGKRWHPCGPEARSRPGTAPRRYAPGTKTSTAGQQNIPHHLLFGGPGFPESGCCFFFLERKTAATRIPAPVVYQKAGGIISSPAVSAKPNIRFMFCTACPAAPFTILSSTDTICSIRPL